MPATRDVSAEIDSVKDDLNALRRDMRGLTEALLEQGKATAHDAKDRVKHSVEENVHYAKDQVEDHPYTAMLCALGAGIAIGSFLSR